MSAARPAMLAIAALAVSVPAAAGPSAALADYTFATWTEADGLASSNIYSIAQDRDGYFWLGTDEGIIRFDGVRFASWNALSRTPLPERRVMSLLSAANGDLWIGFGGSGGVSRVRQRDVTSYSERDGLPHEFVRTLKEDGRGDLWAVSPSGLYRFNGTRWEKIGPEHGLPDGPMWNASEDAAGNFWVIAETGIFRRDTGSETFQAVELINRRVRDLIADTSGHVLTTDPAVGFRVLGQTSVQGHPASVKGYGARWMRDRQGNLWLGTQGQGLWRLMPGSGFDRFTIQTVTQGELAEEVRSIVEDRDGNIWVGTSAGLHRLSPRLIRAVTGLGLVRAVAIGDDGTTWAGTANGLLRLSRGGQRRDELLKVPVFALHKDVTGTLWVGTDMGLFSFAQNRFSPVALPSGTPLRRVVAIASDSHGAVWLCDQERGVFGWKNGQLTSLWPKPEVSRQTAYAVFVDRDDRVWIALSGGLLGLMESDGAVRLFGPIGDGSLRVIFEARDHTLWVGGDDGLSRLVDGRFVTARRQNGLPGSAVTAVVEDSDGRIWAGVGSGIIQFDPKEFEDLGLNPSHPIRYKTYDGSDGLAGTPAWSATPSSARGIDGRLWFVTSSGLAVVDPAALRSKHQEPRAQIAAVLADEQIFDPGRPAALRPFTQRLQIEYTATGFVSPMKLRFRYRLDGFDRGWIDAGTRRQAFYTNLSPREYRFRVGASTSEGTWNEATRSFDFSIQPAFYQTKWFDLAAAVMVLPLVWAIWRLRLRQIQQRFALVMSERARMGRELHDTLLQSLVGVSLQFEGLSHRVDPSSPWLRQELLRLRMQVEEYIREARQSISGLQSPALEGPDLAEALRQTGIRLTDGSTTQFDLDVSGTPRRCRPGVEEQLLRIGREALSNAVHHAQAAQIRLHLRYSRRSVALRIVDDGIGFDGRQVKGHYGLANMHERARQLGGRFRIVTLAGKGTEVDVVVPFR